MSTRFGSDAEHPDCCRVWVVDLRQGPGAVGESDRPDDPATQLGNEYLAVRRATGDVPEVALIELVADVFERAVRANDEIAETFVFVRACFTDDDGRQGLRRGSRGRVAWPGLAVDGGRRGRV